MILKPTNIRVYTKSSRRGKRKSLFALTRTIQCCAHVIPRARLCLCQVFSGSERFEKVRHSNRISHHDLFTPRLSLIHGPPLTPVIPPYPSPPPPSPSWHRWRWVAPKSRSAPPGKVTAARASLGSHVLTISSRPLWNYANILVQFPWVWNTN